MSAVSFKFNKEGVLQVESYGSQHLRISNVRRY